MLRQKSPYISNPNRLADLIAAIQVMGSYGFASRPLDRWEARLGRIPVSAERWEFVFKEHPEFFTIQDDKVSLVWRRSRERLYDTFAQELVSRETAAALKQVEDTSGEKRLSRPPLDEKQIGTLVDIAVRLHEREIQHRQENRWWITAVLGILGLVFSLATK